MADFYAEMQGIASGILAEFKQGTITLSRTPTAAPETETPWEPGAPTTTTYTLDAVARGANQTEIGSAYTNGTLVLASDLVVTCAVPEVEPQMTDAVTIDGREYVIKGISRKPAAGTPVAYALFVGF